MRRRYFDSATLDKVKNLYLNGESIYYIARSIGAYHKAVRNNLEWVGIKTERRWKVNRYWLGKKRKLTKIHKQRIRLHLERQFKNKQETSIEVKLYQELKRRGLLFEKQKLVNGKFIVDAYVPSLNLVIEADGSYWHNQSRIIKKDNAENAYLLKCGYKLLRLSETEIKNGNFISKIEEALN